MAGWHRNDFLTMRRHENEFYFWMVERWWRNRITLQWRADDGTTIWLENDKNYFGMSKWLRTDGMTSEWWNNIGMTLWHQNDSGMMELHQSDGELTRRSTIIYVVTLSTEQAKKGNVYRCRVVSFQGTSFRGGTTQQRFDASFWCRFISGRG